MGKHKGKGKESKCRHKLSKSSRYEACLEEEEDSSRLETGTRGTSFGLSFPYIYIDERDDSGLLTPARMFFVVVGRWLLSRWTYCSIVLGFVKG